MMKRFVVISSLTCSGSNFWFPRSQGEDVEVPYIKVGFSSALSNLRIVVNDLLSLSGPR